jgi:hypothetical protein
MLFDFFLFWNHNKKFLKNQLRTFKNTSLLKHSIVLFLVLMITICSIYESNKLNCLSIFFNPFSLIMQIINFSSNQLPTFFFYLLRKNGQSIMPICRKEIIDYIFHRWDVSCAKWLVSCENYSLVNGIRLGI